MMEASTAARQRFLGASYEFPIELFATGSSISLPCKIFSFGTASLLSGHIPDFRKAVMAYSRRKAFYSYPQRALLVKGRGLLFFVGFAGDFLHNTFLQLLKNSAFAG